MKLSDFIRGHSEEIATAWASFARTCEPAAATLNIAQLRDHILPLLAFIAADMDRGQTPFEQHEKSVGRKSEGETSSTEAAVHGALRVIADFTVDQVIAEYRALRASILDLWFKNLPIPGDLELNQVVRFNESIDQMISESVARHAQLEAAERDKSKKRDAFLATLSHELRGPLGALSNAVYIVAKHGAADPGLVPVTAIMVRQIRHLNRLLKDLLDVVRISQDIVSLQLTPTDIRECLQDAVEANRELLTQKTHILKLHMPDAPLVAEIDCTRIVQVVSNLLNNAAKHSPAGTTIDVSLTSTHDHFQISVKDNGIGIDPELLPRIFEAFYVNHEKDLAKNGLGIGLWLSRRLVELHGGSIIANSDGPGSGAEFRAVLPLNLR